MNSSDEEASRITSEFLSGRFYNLLLRPYFEERKKDLIEKTDNLINNDAPKNTFSVISGRRKEIFDLEMQIEQWLRRFSKQDK